jgi:hypothetical protein
MALFPQGLTQVDGRCNAGERRVLHQLKRCLEDDYLVWHDVPIGPRARQPDFVILSPRWGVLLLEVKDWRRNTLAGATRDAVELDTPRGRTVHAHPLRQARDYMLELVDLMRADPALTHTHGPFAGRLLFPYGWGVVMSSLRQADVQQTDFADLFAPARTLLRDDLEDSLTPAQFQHRLWGMFTVSYPHTLTLPQRDRIRWHLFPEIRLPTQAELVFAHPADAQPGDTPAPAGVPAPTLPPLLPGLMQVMDLQQEQIARSLGEGHRVIHGVAGSGKTMILIFRAQFLATVARPELPILVMCFNRTLATRIEALLHQRGVDERVQVRTFHAWCQDMVRSYQIDVPGRAPGRKADPGHGYFEALAAALQRAVESGRVPGGQYSALLIDEAHDFEDAWLKMAAQMVSPQHSHLLVLYDDAQSIYQAQRRKFNFASVGIEARGRTSILRLNYRNTAEVLALAVQCASSLLEGSGQPGPDGLPAVEGLPLVQPTSAGRRGPLPLLLQPRHAQEEAQWLAERITAAVSEGVPPSDIAVLCRTRALMRPVEHALQRAKVPHQSMNAQAFRRFDWQQPSVKLLTLHSAKGLEFAQVYLAGLQALPLKDESPQDALRLLYVGMTRATQMLVLSGHLAQGPTALMTRVQQALHSVAAGFAQPAEG